MDHQRARTTPCVNIIIRGETRAHPLYSPHYPAHEGKTYGPLVAIHTSDNRIVTRAQTFIPKVNNMPRLALGLSKHEMRGWVGAQ